MTLEEAIKHAEEKAEEFDKDIECDECTKCADEHRQLAEWLRELKEYRDNDKRRNH